MKIKVHIDNEASQTNKKTGVGYFTSELINALKETNKIDLQEYIIGGRSRLFNKLYKVTRYFGFELPLRFSNDINNNDFIIGANYLIPKISGTNNVPVIYDLCFIDHPDWVQAKNAYILKKMMPKTLKNSKGSITISEFSAERIRQLYNYKKPILVIGIPPKKSSSTEKKPEALKSLNFKNFFLFISTIEPRKNLHTLLDAFELLPDDVQKNNPLIIAGKPGWDSATLNRLRESINKNIIYLEYVTEHERNWLYRNALCTILPSHYEGFGMMTLESLNEGTPVITSDIPPQKEILGKSGLYFEPTDTKLLAAHMIKMTDVVFRKKILGEQSKVLKKYSWEDTAKKVADFIESLNK